ncbi:hypothetical protein C8F04DRAFT_1195185 [Mycena alexandri]|uniref:Uncharacterized protein n=1 Tax=Mycena alexandri TaxID=1745969 RepID=A0AAD6WUQ1_9AGAR|nr:hypothetical protein C8F04DRAFT_1195185 [Mycena alexandri]
MPIFTSLGPPLIVCFVKLELHFLYTSSPAWVQGPRRLYLRVEENSPLHVSLDPDPRSNAWTMQELCPDRGDHRQFGPGGSARFRFNLKISRHLYQVQLQERLGRVQVQHISPFNQAMFVKVTLYVHDQIFDVNQGTSAGTCFTHRVIAIQVLPS